MENIMQKIKNFSFTFLLGFIVCAVLMTIFFSGQKREMLVTAHDFTWRDFAIQASNYCNNIPTGVMNQMYTISRINLTLMTEEKYGVKTATITETKIADSNILRLLKEGYKITSLPGLRLADNKLNGIGGAKGIAHDGYDLSMLKGKPIKAFQDGKVIHSSWSPSWGWYVVLLLVDKQEWIYAHLDRRPFVHLGNFVKTGDIIGLCGNTGNSRGSHLHWGEYLF